MRHAILIAAVCGILNIVPAWADNDGCDIEANDRIAPELALCSVHAYNIGEATNPTGANKQLMKDVVALKTTVITQQMNKQYEYMDAMIRRFKTQLEKAVLTTKLQAAGAGANSNSNGASGGGYAGTGGAYAGNSGSGASRNDGRVTNIFLNDAQNCASKLDTTDMLNCLAENYSIIYEATNGGQTVSAEARKQLAADFIIMSNSGLLNKKGNLPIMNPTKKVDKADEYDASKCETDRAMSQRSGLQTCLTAHSSNIRNAKDEYNRKNRQDKK